MNPRHQILIGDCLPVGTQVAEIQALVNAAQEVLGWDVVFQIERLEQALLSFR